MTREELIGNLQKEIEASGSSDGDWVRIPRKEAVQILRLLSGYPVVEESPQEAEGQKLFYCMDCSASFRAFPREDPECYEKWHYHTWYALCPKCRREVSLTDRYWR